MKKQLKKKPLNKYLQLTGIVFQMGITIYAGAYFGKKLDAHFNPSKKTFTLIGTLLALLIALYMVLNQVKKINETKD
ncbi:MAG: AtpZ/AtpI family protein [Lutibacter sp.]|uniref:AtpZ/AtpI family protein n=1 Tax=Lutibacter sp. TaxID=1925666 RepID=UPI00299DBEFB|nr:AtpZ/AtpI family protein [Lutibacter sp.]MDX1829643.1 AtpZ/AtpI family protein [Lutibacter sp.]